MNSDYQKNWEIIKSCEQVLVMCYWNGSPLQLHFSGNSLATFVHESHQGLERLIRTGEPIKTIIEKVKEEMNMLEKRCRDAEAKLGKGGSQEALLKEAWTPLLTDEMPTIRKWVIGWFANVVWLLKLKAIKESEEFGFTLHAFKGRTLLQYWEMPPLVR